jgi:hypothetical protein
MSAVCCVLLAATTLVLASFLASCGTYVPEIEEFWGTSGDTDSKVSAVAGQVVCELRRAVQKVVAEGPVVFERRPGEPPPPPQRGFDWFINKWGVQVTLNMNIIENSALTPGISYNNIYRNGITSFPGAAAVTTPQSLSLGASATGSVSATRNDTLNMFFAVKELLNGLDSTDLSCIPSHHPNASLFLESDLKIYDWLRAAMLINRNGAVDYAANATGQAGKNGITHDIKFEIVSSGSVNPQWKLVRFTGNTSPALLAASRDRVQELIITFGPVANGMLAGAAANSHLATQTGSAVSQAIQGTAPH